MTAVKPGSHAGEVPHPEQRQSSEGTEAIAVCIKAPESHVHWKNAAESFSNLLDEDFADIIIEVRNGKGKSQRRRKLCEALTAFKYVRPPLPLCEALTPLPPTMSFSA